MTEPLEHAIDLVLASRARLKILYFSDREMRWIFSYDYRGERRPGEMPDLVNDVQLTAEYAEGLLAPALVLSMHVVIPARLGQQFFAGVDISPGAKTYLEFHYQRDDNTIVSPEYRLIAIQKGARAQVLLGDRKASLVRQIEFPFPVPDRIEIHDRLRVPFRLDDGTISHFELPVRTLR
jgi:hypothetical protein